MHSTSTRASKASPAAARAERAGGSWGEVLQIHFVESGVVGHVGEEDGALDHVFPPRPGRLQHDPQVVHGLTGLRDHAALGQGGRRHARERPDGARQEDQVAAPHRGGEHRQPGHPLGLDDLLAGGGFVHRRLVGRVRRSLRRASGHQHPRDREAGRRRAPPGAARPIRVHQSHGHSSISTPFAAKSSSSARSHDSQLVVRPYTELVLWATTRSRAGKTVIH